MQTIGLKMINNLKRDHQHHQDGKLIRVEIFDSFDKLKENL